MLKRLMVLLALAPLGCTAAYMAATDERSVGTQVDDTAIVAKIKAAYLDSNRSALGLTVFSHQGLVVLTGALEDPRVGERAAAAARSVEGVRKVETYFLPLQPAAVADFGISTKIKAKIVGDLDLRLAQFDLTTVAGHVVLAGVVDRQEKVEQVIRYARSVDGVVAVKSFMQVKSP